MKKIVVFDMKKMWSNNSRWVELCIVVQCTGVFPYVLDMCKNTFLPYEIFSYDKNKKEDVWSIWFRYVCHVTLHCSSNDKSNLLLAAYVTLILDYSLLLVWIKFNLIFVSLYFHYVVCCKTFFIKYYLQFYLVEKFTQIL